MECLDDVFDILDDDENDADLENIMEQYNEDFDFYRLHMNLDEETFIDHDQITTNDDDSKVKKI